MIKDKGRPEPGKQYRLTGGEGTPAISNGNSWAESEVGGEADVTAKIKAGATKFTRAEAFTMYIKAIEARLQVTYKNYPEQIPKILFTEGPRYWKVIRTEKGGGNSVHSFVERETGDILKPAGWNAPAKHARGNILSPDHGASALTDYGVNYLR